MTPTTKCEFCDKRGLPLLLVRDGVAPAGAGAPLAQDLPIELAASAAHYTKRLLRSGYVNVHDEARKRWETYFVTPEGFLFKLLQTPGVTPVLPSKPFNCPDEGHRAVASCITVPDPMNASTIWIGFSDVLWTDAVREAHNDPAYRKRHMLAIDVKAALAGGMLPHTRRIAQIAAVVAEYAMAPGKAIAAFDWNPFKFNTRHGRTDRLKQECEAMRPEKGLIVTLSDPAGVAQELAFLMKWNLDLFINRQPEDRRKLAASAAIDQIEQSVRSQSEVAEVNAAEQLANEQLTGDPFGHLLSESTRKQTENMREVTSTQANRAADNAWRKYAKKFDDTDRKAWQTAFNQKLESYDAKYIAPLALNHAAWMKSTPLANYFECNYDRNHAESGAAYTTVLTHCIISTQDKQACAKLYDEWLKGDITDTKNLLLQAMVLNQTAIADAVKSATTVSIDLRQIPWDNLFAAYTNSVERLSQGTQEAAARLMVQIAGPVARMLGKVLDGTTGFRAAFMATGLISGHPVVVCEIIGGKKEFRAHLIRELVRASGQVVSENQMRRAVAAELKLQQIHGVSLEGSTRKRWLMLADQERIANMPSGLSPKQRAEWLAKSIKTVEAVETLNLGRWRTVINQNVRFGVVTGILQAVSLTKLIADEEKSLANENQDAARRLYAGVTVIAATTSEVIGNAVAGRAALGMRFGQGLALTSATILKFVGKAAGVLVGLFVAGLDAMKAREAKAEKQLGLAWLYGSSAVVGVGLTVAIAGAALLGAAAVPIIGILILLLIGISILIEYVKDNPVQDWLERCPWGVLTAQRYPDLTTEQAQLMNALK
jgi:acid stress-induced BolA-like protein IbaG/YrbA